MKTFFHAPVAFLADTIDASSDAALTATYGDALTQQSLPFTVNVKVFNNSGNISADIQFGDAIVKNTFYNRGRIDGTVDMGIGADRYEALDGGYATGMVAGGKGNDRLLGGSKVDKLSGGKGGDIIKGGGGNDRLFGGAGNDEITGGKGKDVMVGGNGADTFVFQGKTGPDRIKDFANGIDQLDLSAYDLRGFRQLKNADAIIKDGKSSKIDLDAIGGDGVISVDDMRAADWNASDFIF